MKSTSSEDSLPGDSLPDWPEQQLRGNKLEGYRYTSREDVGPESFLMVRQKDGGIKAFYNVCQHRGNQLVVDPKRF